MRDYENCHFCFYKGINEEDKLCCNYPGEEHEIKNDYKECCCYFEQL